jgi:protocatechuate 3,4-dioxygenase beta subunit
MIGRRKVLKAIGTGVALAPVVPLLGCGGDDGPAAGSDSGTPGIDSGTPGTDAGTPGVDSGPRPDAGPSRWATGGTAAMTDRDSYPNPFEGKGGSECALTCAMILGPCYDTVTFDRADVSEGKPGLPVRLALRVVDESCTPIPGAVVDIWHTGVEGIYSGDINPFCSGGAPVPDEHYARGYQTTNADGRVDFDTLFPGWYAGRAIHIHFTIKIGTDAYVTSQLFFEQSLVDEIFAAHPDYAPFGEPDTTNAADGAASDLTDYTLAYARMTDGAMQAYKTLVIRSDLATPLCNA